MASTPKPIRKKLKRLSNEMCAGTDGYHYLYISDADSYANEWTFVWCRTYVTGCLICDGVKPVRGRS
jgi:hypothetical protein